MQVSMNSLENEMGTIPKTERELVGIEREYRVKESLYLYLLQKEAETSIALAASVSDNRIIEEARSTSYPIRPIPKKSYSLALLLGLLIPTGVIFVFEQFNDTVRDKKTIEKLTKIPMLGIVGYSKEHYALVVSEKPKSLIAESFRTVRTNLKYFLKGKEKETILITSSIGSEGKTFSSMNLSIIIALSGKKTVLLGLDLRKPKIVADFEISNDKGVSSFLIGAETIASIIQKTSVENLSIIPSGPIPPNPSELIMGEKMDELINKLQQDFDTIFKEASETSIYITQGFICLDDEGNISNLQRGGSDYTATIIGAVIKAEEVEIWTDIDGMHNNDPRYVENTKPISNLSFDEAAELAYFGAKILHPQTVTPVRADNIPVRLKNTMNPEAYGTLINDNHTENGVKAIAAKDYITAIKIKSGRMLLAHGFLKKVFEIFENYETSIDMITTSEVAISLTVDDDKNLDRIVEALEKFSTVEVDKNQTIVCLVGHSIVNHHETFKLFQILQDVKIRMISYGGSRNNISLLISSKDKIKTLGKLNDYLFELVTL
ncbi:MAG: hypothetical protein COY57_01560 [Flavobacteriales bacterium CG_4_10_14_0_8_um_filter_32_5]|nr:MAG: hypothetical protein COY57_01560 [Flavobacteriales bacterium CG_4_10_14_0_8_um_filter_32_5]